MTLYASDGPCKDAKLSTKTFNIQFLPCTCPIGFQPLELANETNCLCECHVDIAEYVQCNSTTESFIRQSNVWIIEVTLGIDSDAVIHYFVYDHCPFDYCGPISTPVNLNLPNGVDIQCALNRTGTLCGSCKPGFSLSLGSSLCLQCPNHWPLLLVTIIVAVVLAGIGASGKHGKRERERERERKFGKGRQTHICIILYHHRSMLAPLIALS